MSHGEDERLKHAEGSSSIYFMVYLAIAALILAAVGVSFMTGTPAGTRLVLNLAIALVQVVLLSLFFMHLKQSDRLTWLVAAAGIFWLFILFLLMLTDYVTRQYGVY